MIRDLPVPNGWNRQHTLYYRTWYRQGTAQKLWRDSEPMVVPIRMDKHIMLHRQVLPGGIRPASLRDSAVPPPDTMPSEGLSGYGLSVCDDLEADTEVYSRFEAFTLVRDELYSLARKRHRRYLAKEASRIVRFFDHQLEYLEEVPNVKRI